MRIAFLNPPQLSDGKTVQAEDCCWGRVIHVLPSMLLSCATEAKATGNHAVRYIDLSMPWEIEAAQEYDPEAIVYGLAWQYHREVHEMMVELFPDCQHIVLAVPPGYIDEYDMLDPRPAMIVGSEPEAVIRSLPKDTSDRLAWCRLRDRHHRMRPSNFDLLRPIDYGLVPPSYWQHYTSACYQVTRGCPYRCHFCVWGGSTVTYRTFRMRPAKLVAENLKQLRDLSRKHDPVRKDGLPLYLLAAQLTTNRDWLVEFSDLMKDEPYYFQSNVNLGEVTRENIRLLRQAGMASTSAGLEATSDKMLAMIGKPYTLDRAIESILVLDDNFRRVRLHVRTGFGETAEDVLEALEGLKRMKKRGVRSARVDMAPLVHYRGTAIRENASYPLEQLDGYDVESLVMADQPLEAWGKYADELRSYGWLMRWGLTK